MPSVEYQNRSPNQGTSILIELIKEITLAQSFKELAEYLLGILRMMRLQSALI